MIPPPREVLATKVCDSSGEPLVVYHGTCRTFTTFSSEYLLSVGTHFGCLEQANYRIGFYDIQYFGAKTQYTCDMQGCRIIPAYLIIKKLIDLRGHDFGWERPAATAYLLTQSGLISAEEASACTGLKETDTLPTAWWIDIPEGDSRGGSELTIDTPNASKSLSFRNHSIEDSANLLPDPNVIAAEIVEDFEAALSQFATIAADLKK